MLVMAQTQGVAIATSNRGLLLIGYLIHNTPLLMLLQVRLTWLLRIPI